MDITINHNFRIGFCIYAFCVALITFLAIAYPYVYLEQTNTTVYLYKSTPTESNNSGDAKGYSIFLLLLHIVMGIFALGFGYKIINNSTNSSLDKILGLIYVSLAILLCFMYIVIRIKETDIKVLPMGVIMLLLAGINIILGSIFSFNVNKKIQQNRFET